MNHLQPLALKVVRDSSWDDLATRVECFICFDDITDEHHHLVDAHPVCSDCFTCADCGDELRDDTAVFQDDELFCPVCHESNNNTERQAS